MAKAPTVGAVIATRVRKHRTERGWSVRELAEQCAKRGATTLTQASLTNIERGLMGSSTRREGRAVTVEELFTLAYVLDVPPMMLMLPIGDSNEMQICPGVPVETMTAWQ